MTAASATSSRPVWTRLRERREAAGLSRRTLAALAGIDHVTVWRIEAGRTLPNATTIAALAQVLGVDATELVNEPPQGADT